MAAAGIQRGSHVVLRDTQGERRVFHLGSSDRALKMGKYPPIPIEAVLAVPHGATLWRVDNAWVRHHRLGMDAGTCEAAEVSETNQHLAQDGSAQALTPDEVRDLKQKHSGEQVVEAIASNSSTFESKTKFAQEKYLKKKNVKHLQQITVLRPTVMELCETYMQQSRLKMCGLRFDYLSSILCQADLQSHGRYFVVDCACGLVVAAMAQQLCGLGHIFRGYSRGCPDKGLAELDIGDARRAVHSLPLEALRSSDPWSHEWFQPSRESAASQVAEAPEEKRALIESKAMRAQHRRESLQELLAQPVDAVVVVTGEEDVELTAEAVEVGLAHLGPGGRLVMYGQLLQPLAARQGELRANDGFIDVRLIQLLTREYQVLPMRTHPHMSAEAQLTDGFLLSATKVVDAGMDEGTQVQAAAGGKLSAAAGGAAPAAGGDVDAEAAEKRRRLD